MAGAFFEEQVVFLFFHAFERKVLRTHQDEKLRRVLLKSFPRQLMKRPSPPLPHPLFLEMHGLQRIVVHMLHGRHLFFANRFTIRFAKYQRNMYMGACHPYFWQALECVVARGFMNRQDELDRRSGICNIFSPGRETTQKHKSYLIRQACATSLPKSHQFHRKDGQGLALKSFQ